jgi:thymidylate synthase ThyX
MMICDSVSAAGNRLTTLALRYPKFIHGEFMTHRVFSRNASSSRAIPVRKNLDEAGDDRLRAYPVYWGAEQKGMQSGEELTEQDFNEARFEWEQAALDAKKHAENLVRIGAHKSIVNRILEPFLHINVVVSATEFANFFGLRLDRAAQPEIRVLAEAMWQVMNESTPQLAQQGNWHLPFVGPEDIDWAVKNRPILEELVPLLDQADRIMEVMKQVSVARNARISYLSYETGRRSTVAEDVALYDRLLASKHLSPFEHVATPDTQINSQCKCGYIQGLEWEHPDEHGNFTGWRQLRKMIPGEAVTPLPEGYR